MFEDIDNDRGGLAITRTSDDRVIVYAIWTRNATGMLPLDAAWALLAERYPDDPRFLLFATLEELRSGQPSKEWTPGVFLEKLRKILDGAGGKLNPEVRDLLAVAEDHLHPLSEQDASRLHLIRGRVGSRIENADAATKRLSRLATDIVRELHDRTSGGARIGRASGPQAVANEWKSLLADASGTRTAYSSTAKVTAGDVVEHPKFGPGVVTAVEPGRASILFESGSRKLVIG